MKKILLLGMLFLLLLSVRVISDDTNPPVITIISPENNKTYAPNCVDLTFTVNEPTSWTAYSLDSASNQTITGNTTLTNLTDGNHDVIVYAKDLSNNTGTSDTTYFSVCFGDVTGDGYVGIDDTTETANHYGESPSSPGWDPKYDMNCDDYIGIDDIVAVNEQFGKSC